MRFVRFLARASPLRLVALSLSFGAAFCWPLLTHPGELGVLDDWDQHLVLHWVPYETVVRYAQLPLWNPFICGGMPMLGHPQSRWLSPFFLLHLAFGPEAALPLEIVAHTALAFAGALVLGRTVGVSWMAALAPAVIFAGSSYWYLHLAEGHTTWMAYAYMPWIVAAALSSRPVLAGAGLALALVEGGVYAVAHVLIAVAVLALYLAAAQRTLRPLTVVGLAAVIAGGLAAPKLLEMERVLTQYPRFTDSREAVSASLLVRSLVDSDQDLETPVPPGAEYSFHEYGAYVGPFALVLALIGAAAVRRAALPWLLLLVVGVALSLGWTMGGEYSPWALLHELPGYSSLRIPSRMIVLVVLAVAVLAGFGADRLRQTGRGWGAAAAIVLVGAALVDMARVGPPNLQHVFERPREARDPSPDFAQLRGDDFRQMYSLVRANIGGLNCYEPLDPDVFPVGSNEPGYRGEQYMLGGGTVRRVSWSPNRLTFAVGSDSSDVLVINANYYPAWLVSSGVGQTFNHDGLLAVRVPAGSQELVIAYDTTRFFAGLFVSAAALAGALLLGARERRPQLTDLRQL